MKRTLALLSIFLALPLTAYAGGGCDIIALGDTSCVPMLKAISSSDHLSEKTDSSGWTCKKSENGAATANCAGTVSELSDADSPGTLKYAFNSADVDTAGSLHLHVTASGMDPIDFVAQVGLPYNVVGSRGTMQSATSSTAVLAAAESSADDRWNGYKIVTLGGTAGGTYACCTDFTNSSDTCAIDAWTGGTPSSDTTYDLVPDPVCKRVAETTTVPSVNEMGVIEMVRVMYQLVVNKFDSTSAEQIWYRSDGSTAWTTKDLTDDNTTYTRTAQETND